MKKAFLTQLAVAAWICLPATAQTVDEIIARNVAARGGLDKIKAVQSIRISGRATFGGGMEAPFTIEMKRPKRARMEFTIQGLTATRAYDGKSGWQAMPFLGKKEPEPLSADDLKDIEEQADVDGELVDYKAKGHQVELVGKDKVEGADTYKLKVTLQNGDVKYEYLDMDSYLVIKEETKRMVRGNEVEVEQSIGDYKEVDGLLFPFAIEGARKDSPQRQKFIVEKIELNVPVDDARFTMPALNPAETKPPESKPTEPKPPMGLLG